MASDETTLLIDPLSMEDFNPVARLMADESRMRVIHNAPFERRILRQEGMDIRNVYDTLVASREIYGRKTTGGHGMLSTYSPAGKILVGLTPTTDGDDMLSTYSPAGKMLVGLAPTTDGEGMLSTYSPAGTELVALRANGNGGLLQITNKTGEDVVQAHADEYGNGVVGAFNRKGKGRTLQPGP